MATLAALVKGAEAACSIEAVLEVAEELSLLPSVNDGGENRILKKH